ncbi:MAG: AAA family ATPase [Aquihabitans sp.]
MPEPAPDTTTTLEWLHHLYGTTEQGWLTLFCLNRVTGKRHVEWAPVDLLDLLADKAAEHEPTSCVWFGVATRHQRLDGGRRGGIEDCDAIPGLWVDIDVTGPGHADVGRLATDIHHARRIAAAFPLPPTAVINTGGGLQAWWLFPEMVDLDDSTRPLLAAWGTTWKRIGEEHDVDLDNVFDAPRIMRLPGTTNRKAGLARPVAVESADWQRRYGADDLEQHLDAPPEPPRHRSASTLPYIGPERPGDAYSLRHTGGDILARHGFTLGHTDHTGNEHWVRPGKEAREGTSATVYAEDGHTTIWSDTVRSMHPTIETMRPYDPFGLITHLEHHGDFGAATTSLRAAGYGASQTDIGIAIIGAAVEQAAEVAEEIADQQRGDWAPIDLDDVLNGDHQPPLPEILQPPTGPALIYKCRVNAIFGESGVGKTWVTLAAIAEVIRNGGTVMQIDLEDTPHGIVARLIALGLTPKQIREQFIYLSPETGWSAVAQAVVAQIIEDRHPELVVIDSVGEAMAAAGVKGNDDDDVARWFVQFPKFIAHRGPAVIIVDHVPKDPNAPSRYMIGSQRKTAATNGAIYRVESIKTPSKTDDGMLKLVVAKDRHGNHTQGKTAAMVAITHSLEGGVILTLSQPDATPQNEDGSFRPTIIMERVSRVVEDTPGLSGREIESRVVGKAVHVRTATGLLLTEGFIDSVMQTGKGGGFRFESVKPFRNDLDVVESHAVSPRIERARPTASYRVPEAGDAVPLQPRPPAPSPTGQGRGWGPSQDHPIEANRVPVGAPVDNYDDEDDDNMFTDTGDNDQ